MLAASGAELGAGLLKSTVGKASAIEAGTASAVEAGTASAAGAESSWWKIIKEKDYRKKIATLLGQDVDHRVEAQTLQHALEAFIKKSGRKPTVKEMEELNATFNSRSNLKAVDLSVNRRWGSLNMWLNKGKELDATKHAELIHKQLQGMKDIRACTGGDMCLRAGTFAESVFNTANEKLLSQMRSICGMEGVARHLCKDVVTGRRRLGRHFLRRGI